MGDSIIRIKPFHYIHVLDNNANVTFVQVGPLTFTRQDHQKVVFGPEPMIMIPPRNYVVISNPVERKPDGTVVTDEHGNAKLKHGDEEIRFDSEPFPLYPGEKLSGKITPLQIVAPLTALRLRALRDFDEGKEGAQVRRTAGEEWLFQGPGTYIPRVEVSVVELIRATIIKPNTALKVRARKACKDSSNQDRKAGEEWLIKQVGAYLPGIDEEIIERVNAITLTEKKALHLRAIRTFVDSFKKQRKAGEEWLITLADAETHIPDVYEELVGEVEITTLSSSQYCVVLDPVDSSGKQLFGQKELRRGEACFFLLPGERLERGIQNHYILSEEEALLLRATETFTENGVAHAPGDLWMIYGPTDYVPPVEVEIIEKRKQIPLDENEGIYVRDVRTGRVRSIVGETYMLKPSEELWPKDLPKEVEALLAKEKFSDTRGSRDKTRVVSYRAPHNTAVQIYDYKEKKSRVVFGPDLVLLGPDEHFTILSLSGDKPKRPHVIKAIALQLGPEYTTDIITVETSDHARLSLKLSYNWKFDIDKNNEDDAYKIFQVPDFVGDSCKAIASRVRGAVAAVPFDNFHKNSAKIIRGAVFGVDGDRVKDEFPFPANKLVITNVDIQSVEPVDQRTRDALQKSVQLAIEITTNSQEAAARHEAERLEQEARGRLERQKIEDESKAEEARRHLLGLQAESAAVESTGQAKAEAKARADAAEIEGEASVQQARLKAEALKITSEAELKQQTDYQHNEIEHKKALTTLEITKKKQMADIEADKFKNLVNSIGADTIRAISQAGPELQAKLLQGLGLKSFLITDGNSPINLFNTAQGMIGAAPTH